MKKYKINTYTHTHIHTYIALATLTDGAFSIERGAKAANDGLSGGNGSSCVVAR
jgi:hypothetical protein